MIDVKDIDFEHRSLLSFKQNGEEKIIQFVDESDNINFNFDFKGNKVETMVLD